MDTVIILMVSLKDSAAKRLGVWFFTGSYELIIMVAYFRENKLNSEEKLKKTIKSSTVGIDKSP